MDLHELDGEKVGDRIDAVVIKAGPDIRLSRKLAVARRAKAELRAAWEARIPVLGKVLSRNKGGFEVAIGGRRRAPGVLPRLPDRRRAPRRAGPRSSSSARSFDFRVIEYSEDGRRVVVSPRRAPARGARAKARRDRARRSSSAPS